MANVRAFTRSVMRVTAAVVVTLLGGLAIGATLLRQPTFRALPFENAIRSDPQRLERHVRFLTTDVRPRSDNHPANLARAAEYIATELRATGADVDLQHFEARRSMYANVVASVGPRNGLAPVVVGAHYDAFAATGDLPGADDNASGTAGLLELARLLAGADLRRPVILVAYANEEPPFFGSDDMGSAVHARTLAESGTPAHGMICLEMIGYFSETQTWPNKLFELVYPSHGDFIAVAGGWPDRHLTRTVKRAIAGAGGIDAVSFTGPRETSDASDHRNYWTHGWPAVLVTDTAFLRNPNYHTLRDTAETLDYQRMARVIDGIASAAVHLSHDE